MDSRTHADHVRIAASKCFTIPRSTLLVFHLQLAEQSFLRASSDRGGQLEKIIALNANSKTSWGKRGQWQSGWMATSVSTVIGKSVGVLA